MTTEKTHEPEPEIMVDMAALVALQGRQRIVLGELDGVTLSAERTVSGGLLVSAAENGTVEPFTLFDEEELAELRHDVEDELAEQQDARESGESSGDVGVLLRLHKHKRRKCRPTGLKIDCRVSRCGNNGKNIDHLNCKGIFRRYICWCRR